MSKDDAPSPAEFIKGFMAERAERRNAVLAETAKGIIASMVVAYALRKKS